MLESYNLSNQFKPHSQKQEENRGVGGNDEERGGKLTSLRYKGDWKEGPEPFHFFVPESWEHKMRVSCVSPTSAFPTDGVRASEDASWGRTLHRLVMPWHLTSRDTHLLSRRQWGQGRLYTGVGLPVCLLASLAAVCVSWWEPLRVQSSLTLNVLAGRLAWMASLSVQRWYDNGLVLPSLSILEYLTGYWLT